MQRDFADRIWPVDVAVAERWGRLRQRRALPSLNGLLAATALHHGAMLVTRNHAEIAATGLARYDPFDGAGSEHGPPGWQDP
ncbi:MAG: PIN domain-containing protein [Deltaproteobacteria bacterium]|nr:PIN domain-containing protein [Deltaproteobacteria bacterium]